MLAFIKGQDRTCELELALARGAKTIYINCSKINWKKDSRSWLTPDWQKHPQKTKKIKQTKNLKDDFQSIKSKLNNDFSFKYISNWAISPQIETSCFRLLPKPFWREAKTSFPVRKAIIAVLFMWKYQMPGRQPGCSAN